MMISPLEMIIRLILGALIGGGIGFEREIHGRAAGFRTQLIVCVAAVLIMIISENYYLHHQQTHPEIQIDPGRIASGALIGIGFLGAGVIVKSGLDIRGLTTAASIWIVSAIGLAIGAGLYLEGLVTFSITIIALVILRRVERSIRPVQFKLITISAGIVDDIEDAVRAVISKKGMLIHSVDYERERDKDEITLLFRVSVRERDSLKNVFSELSSDNRIRTIRINSPDRKVLG
jgi:putative Mg2+ transporter-C (MgtC) family protein